MIDKATRPAPLSAINVQSAAKYPAAEGDFNGCQLKIEVSGFGLGFIQELTFKQTGLNGYIWCPFLEKWTDKVWWISEFNAVSPLEIINRLRLNRFKNPLDPVLLFENVKSQVH